MIQERDKQAGKDFNKVARDEMVKAQHHFDMLRKIAKEDYEAMLAHQRSQEKLVTVTTDELRIEALRAMDPAELLANTSELQKKADMIERQMNRSSLTRANLDL